MATSNNFAFRRSTNPLIIPVGPVPSKFVVPEEFFKEGGPGYAATSFWVCNPNLFWVRLIGSGDGRTSTGEYVEITETTGWLWQPGFSGAFSTQFPRFMSVLAVNRQGLSPGSGTIEISYGAGT